MKDQDQDVTFDRLAHLSTTAPSEVHAAEIRVRCHAALARRRRGYASGLPRQAPRGLTPISLALSALAASYVLVVIRQAMWMYGAW